MKEAISNGESIGNIANLSRSDLYKLIRGKQEFEVEEESLSDYPLSGNEPEEIIESCLKSVRCLDSNALEKKIVQASVKYSRMALLERIVYPLIHEIGMRWEKGELKVVHEHLASAVIRNFLGNMLVSQQPHPAAPRAVVTTPVGQLHELGALMAAVAASIEGWRVVYLGPNIPIEDMAMAVKEHKAEVLALSIVYPQDDPQLLQELMQLPIYMGDGVSIIVGGRAASAFRRVLKEIGAIEVVDLTEFRKQLKVTSIGTAVD